MLAGLMKTLAIDSATNDASASERGGTGRNAKFHQTQRKSRRLMIDRESRKQPAKLMSQARQMPVVRAVFRQSLRNASVASKCRPTPANTNTTVNENHGAIKPKIARALKCRPLGSSGGRGAASSSAASAIIRSQEYCLISDE